VVVQALQRALAPLPGAASGVPWSAQGAWKTVQRERGVRGAQSVAPLAVRALAPVAAAEVQRGLEGEQGLFCGRTRTFFTL